MKVNYTLPGLLSESVPAPATELEHAAQPFAAQLRRLRGGERTDWRTLLRLNAPPAGAVNIGPPPLYGTEPRNGASQRAWWRAMLDKQTRLRQKSPQPAPVQQMLALLFKTQQIEDEVFARHFAEAAD